MQYVWARSWKWQWTGKIYPILKNTPQKKGISWQLECVLLFLYCEKICRIQEGLDDAAVACGAKMSAQNSLATEHEQLRYFVIAFLHVCRCMIVCILIYTCIWIYTYTYTCIHTNIYTSMEFGHDLSRCVYMNFRTKIHTWYIYIYICICICIYLYKYIYVYIYTYIYIDLHI